MKKGRQLFKLIIMHIGTKSVRIDRYLLAGAVRTLYES